MADDNTNPNPTGDNEPKEPEKPEVNTPAGDNQPDPKPPEEPGEPASPEDNQPTDPPKPPETKEPEPPENPNKEPTEKPPSRREQLRIRQVLDKLKQSGGDQPATNREPGGLDYEEALDADPETIARLKDDRQKVSDESYRRGKEEFNAVNFRMGLRVDTPRVEGKYSQLNKESKDFNPALTDAINHMYLSTVGYNPGDPKQSIPETVQNPDLSYLEYVDSVYELANTIAGEKTAMTAKNVAQQASQTGLRPDGSSARGLNLNKVPEEMTNEELNAVISQVIPPQK